MGILLEIVNKHTEDNKYRVDNIKNYMDKLYDFEFKKPTRTDRYTNGNVLIKDNIILGYVVIDTRTKYIISIDVHHDYDTVDLYNRLIIIGKDLGATHISVNIDNSRLKYICEKCGYSMVNQDKYMYYMKL